MTETIIARILERANRPDLQVDFSADPEVSKVIGDATRYELILRALLDNAIHYSNKAGKISVLLNKQGDSVQLSVKDDGIGIPEEDLPKVFDRFYRGGNVGHTRGVGLGLSLVKRNMDIHGGTVRLNSRLNKYTEVICEFLENGPEPPHRGGLLENVGDYNLV